ncbi:ribosome maturation factor RimM [Synechococcus sp. CS-602]|nr:ribosome maturation factor RimM [Synechococcus sp. CS-603]MCT0204741.1 ribosome maturation factor RimM [Synechococcus sp. CS-602]MCT0246163.1 ribosome maturation factor RimM [Synechococcus sp. CS-601]TWB91106.1 16S rRNA processing protein RimM [Synechococcus sp. Ace-Pa]
MDSGDQAATGAGAGSAKGTVAGSEEDEWLVVGRVVGAQGLQGELRMLPRTDFPARFTRPGRRWLRHKRETPRQVQLLSGRQLPGRELFIVRFEGIHSREAAEALVDHDLLVSAEDRPPLAEGEFHLLDLQGLAVRLAPEGTVIGTVVDLIHAGNDLLEVELIAPESHEQPPEPTQDSGQAAGKTSGKTSAKTSAKLRRVLIPFVLPIVPRVNVGEGWLEITPPPGLLDQ